MKEEERQDRRKTRGFSLVAVVVSIIALLLGIFLPVSNASEQITKSLNYDVLAPYVKDYLVAHDLLDANGLVPVPSTGSDEPDAVGIEQVIDQLISTGKFDYLKGEKGDVGSAGAKGEIGATGATGAQGEQGIPGSYAGKGDKGDTGAIGPQGATGATGPQGAKGDKGDKGDTGATGAAGADGEDGLITAVGSIFAASGGTLSLKPCAVDEVLMSDGSTWECATVSSSGVDENTTNASAAIALSGTSIEASITDSEGNTVKTSPLDLGATFATDAELSSAIAAIDLSSYATTGQLSALTTRVATLEAASSNQGGRITALETAAAGYVTDTELTAALGNYYTKSQTYSQSEVDSKLSDLETDISAAKQDTLPTCANGEVIKYNTTSAKWECAADLNNVSGDGSNFATENWVNTYVASQNFATTSALNTLDGKVTGVITNVDAIDTRVAALEGAGYVTTSALVPYLKTADLSAEMKTRLAAGTGVSINENGGIITINSTAQTDIFSVVNGHDSVASPDSNRIYIDVSTNPTSQWVYEGNNWRQIGEVNAEMTDYYTKTQIDGAIANAISTNNGNYTTTSSLNTLLGSKADQTALDTTNSNLTATNTNLSTARQDITDLENNLSSNYTTTSALTPMLAAKQDKLPTCADGEVVKYVLTTNSWTCGADNNTTTDLTGYARESWVNSQISTNNSNYTTTTDLTTMLTDYTTDTELATATNDMATGTSVASGYVSKSALNCSAAQALVGTGTNGTVGCRAIQDITTGSLAANNGLITANTLATVMANYYTKTDIDNRLQNMATGADGPIVFQIVTVMPDPSTQDPNTVYLLKGAN